MNSASTKVPALEKTVTRTLQDLQTVATEKKDFHLADFIQRELLGKKVNIIKEIGDCLTKIKRAGDGIGIHIMDRELEKMMVTQTIVDLKTMVSNWKHTVDGEFLGKQVEIVKEITDCLATIKMI